MKKQIFIITKNINPLLQGVLKELHSELFFMEHFDSVFTRDESTGKVDDFFKVLDQCKGPAESLFVLYAGEGLKPRVYAIDCQAMDLNGLEEGVARSVFSSNGLNIPICHTVLKTAVMEFCTSLKTKPA